MARSRRTRSRSTRSSRSGKTWSRTTTRPPDTRLRGTARWLRRGGERVASATEHDVVDVVRRRCGARWTGPLLVQLDVPFRRAGEGRCEVVDRYVGIRIKWSAVGGGVDGRTQRLGIVADDEQRAARRHRVQQVADTPAIWCARDRRVLRRDQIERCGFVGIERVGVCVEALDAQTTARRRGLDPVERALRDIAGGHAPALFSKPDRVTAFARAHVEGAAGRNAADLVDECAVRVTAPDLVVAVAMVPVGLVG